MKGVGESITAILVAVIGLATLAVIVGRNAQTSNVIASAGKAFTSILQVAVSPVK